MIGQRDLILPVVKTIQNTTSSVPSTTTIETPTPPQTSHRDKRTKDIPEKPHSRLTKLLIDNHTATEHLNSIGDSVPDGIRIEIKPAGVYTEEPTFKENGLLDYRNVSSKWLRSPQTT